MKRNLIFICLIALLGAGLFAQESIAVFPFEDLDKVFSRNEAVMFYRNFSNEFTNSNAGKFKIVPRQEVEKLINTEASFQLSDFSAKAKTVEMQRVLNGTQILSGVIGRVGSRLSITVSLYTYPELEQLPGGTSLRVTSIDELFDKIPELVKNMQEAIGSNIYFTGPLIGKWKAKDNNFRIEFNNDGNFIGTFYESKTAIGYWVSRTKGYDGKYYSSLYNYFNGGSGHYGEEYKKIKGSISGTYTFTTGTISLIYIISGTLETQSLVLERQSFGTSHEERISTSSYTSQGNLSVSYTISPDRKILIIDQNPIFLKSVITNYGSEPAVYYSEFLKEN